MQQSKGTLVILEAGTRWPEWLAKDGVTKFVQCEDEPGWEFHERVEFCVQWCVERLARKFSSVVIACADAAHSADPHSAESRRSLIVAMVAHLERMGGGKLVLTGAADYAARRAQADLALEVSEFLDDLGSPVSCRMRSQRRDAA